MGCTTYGIYGISRRHGNGTLDLADLLPRPKQAERDISPSGTARAAPGNLIYCTTYIIH